MDELLVKYLAGEANQEERSRAELWINTSDSNRKYFEHFKLIWGQSQKLAYKSNVDEDAAWNRFRARLQKEYAQAPKPKSNMQWLKAAAVILIASGLALFGPYFIKHSESARTVIPASSPGEQVTFVKTVATDHIKTDTLSDGSVVTMNKYSSLNYPASFDGHNRYVELSGEAFFKVKHDPAKPFVIKADELLITVLGTSFNVRNRGDTVGVVVETGVVSVKKQQQIITLYAGEKLTTLKSNNLLTKSSNTDKSYRLYFDKSAAAQIKPTRPLKPNTSKGDSALDFKKHPDLLQKILNDPSKLRAILKNYRSKGNDITFRRAIVRGVIAEIKNEKLLGADPVRSFRLNEGEFIINDRRQPEAVHGRFKDKFIKEPGYTIYFGGAPKNGKGVYLSPDSL